MSDEGKRASEDILASLHSLVAESLIEKIKSGEASSSDLSVAIKFLKDNGINCIGTANDDMKQLVDALPSFPLDDGYDPMRGTNDIVYRQ